MFVFFAKPFFYPALPSPFSNPANVDHKVKSQEELTDFVTALLRETMDLRR